MNNKPICAREGRCNHYNGIYGPGMKEHHTCDAGVNYGELAGGRGEFGWVKKLPCYHADAEAVPCDKKQLPTPEQILAWDEWVNARTTKTMQAIKLCREHADGKVGIRGEVACPSCGKRLRYSVASVNGHLWGQCETPECLGWMQ